uniref:Conserved oligomeric Golgi complex subunit 2 n=1 Tax=Anthurium amnicola TaxID=1678845 RepID=A0A1D1YH47_9ARAE
MGPMADLPAPSPRPATDIFGDPIDAQPLWFKKASFLRPDFDPEAYVADLRTFVPLESLRAELRAYLGSLNSELVDHLNRDYADFVSLSTRLVDVDAAVARMRAPLAELRDKVSVLRGNIASSLAALNGGLARRAEASEAREVLELLLDAFHVVSNVEKLIENNDTMVNPEKTRSVLLERIASEMNRLKFYVAHAQNLPFIENMEKRIHGASLLLDDSLRHCFVSGLERKDHEALLNCLRAYAATGNTTGAEEVFRTTIVSPLIQKIIPYSPSNLDGYALSNDLEEDYQQIMQIIEAECKCFLDIASSANSGFHVFDFLANSILKEVLFAIQKGKPGAFSPGRPTEFLKNYKLSLHFLSYLEGYCPSRSAVAKFRSEDVYVDFMKQWNIGVYFSLRFQEIAGNLDSALMVAAITPVSNLLPAQGDYEGLILKQSITLLDSLKSCWRDDVLVLSFSDKFLRLSLQLISRYSTWLSSGLAARKMNSSGSIPSTEWAISALPEDFVYVMHDVNYLVAELKNGFLGNVQHLLHSCSFEVLDLVKQSILHAGKSLDDLIPSLLDAIIEAIVEKSAEEFKHLKAITATYRMTIKGPPVRHSPYVSGLLRPVKAFLDGERIVYLTTETRKQLLLSAAERITSRYYDLVAELVDTVRKTESSLQRIRQTAQRRGGTSSDASDNSISNTDKLCMQYFLDIQEYGRNLAELGVAAADIPAYRSLWQCVAPADRQSTINF